MFSGFIFLISTSLSFDANTGSKKFDEHLSEINKDALSDLSSFNLKIAEYYLVDQDEVAELMSIMEPAEVLLTYEISRLLDKPTEEIVSNVKNNKNEGWHKVLTSLGIEQNSSNYKYLSNIQLFDVHQLDSGLSKK